MTQKRCIVYIDGFNLYFAIRERGWRKCLWMDVQTFAEQLLPPDHTLEKAKYFTSRISGPPDKVRRQSTIIDANGTRPLVAFFYGEYQKVSVTCRKCGDTHIAHHEKKTDVNIAVEMLADAFQDAYDTAVLVSADADLQGPIATVRRLFPAKSIRVAFPPGRNSATLKNAANNHLFIGQPLLESCEFPDEVTQANGYVLRRPAKWK